MSSANNNTCFDSSNDDAYFFKQKVQGLNFLKAQFIIESFLGSTSIIIQVLSKTLTRHINLIFVPKICIWVNILIFPINLCILIYFISLFCFLQFHFLIFLEILYEVKIVLSYQLSLMLMITGFSASFFRY